MIGRKNWIEKLRWNYKRLLFKFVRGNTKLFVIIKIFRIGIPLNTCTKRNYFNDNIKILDILNLDKVFRK